MSKVYASNIEIKAKELLSPMKVNCPDSMWQELNYQLNDLSKRNESKISGKLYTPRTLMIVLGGIILLILVGWKFSSKFTGSLANTSYNNTPAPQPPTNNKPASNIIFSGNTEKKKDSVALVAHKDSLKRAAAEDSLKKAAQYAKTQDSIKARVVNVPAVNQLPQKVDTAALNAYYARVRAYRHKRDSIRLVYARQDSARKANMHKVVPRHDSVTVMAPADSAR